MSKKKRVKHENSGRTIFRKFFGPAARYKPHTIDTAQYWDLMFAADTRDIECYRAKHSFNLPGLYCKSPGTKIQGIGPRHVRKGQPLMVRDEGDRVDVEKLATKTHIEHVFQLTQSQWGELKLNLIKVNFRKKYG